MSVEKPAHTPVETKEAKIKRKLKELDAVFKEFTKAVVYISTNLKDNLRNGVKTNSVTSEFIKKLSSAAKAKRKLYKYKRRLVPTLGKTTYLSKKDEANLSRSAYIENLKELELYSDFLKLCKEKVDLIKGGIFDDSGSYVPYCPFNLGIPGAKLPGLTAQELKSLHKLPLRKAVAKLKEHKKRLHALVNATHPHPRVGLIRDKKTLRRLRAMAPAQAIIEIAKLKKVREAARKRAEEASKKRDAKRLRDLEREIG